MEALQSIESIDITTLAHCLMTNYQKKTPTLMLLLAVLDAIAVMHQKHHVELQQFQSRLSQVMANYRQHSTALLAQVKLLVKPAATVLDEESITALEQSQQALLPVLQQEDILDQAMAAIEQQFANRLLELSQCCQRLPSLLPKATITETESLVAELLPLCQPLSDSTSPVAANSCHQAGDVDLFD